MSRARDLADLGGSADAGGLTGRNLIINGAMTIDQRNGGSSVTASAGNNYVIDRWLVYADAGSDISAQQVTDAPTGFKNSQKITSLAATTPGVDVYYFVCQRIEGHNVSQLGWGASGASTVTFSFWVKSSLTGTFSGAFGNSSFNRSYPFTYSISSANTWEKKTITVDGDTTGTWATDNSTGLQVVFDLGSGSNRAGTADTWSANDYRKVTGSVSLIETNAATWQITGVQLEVGETATPFEHEDYGTTLAKCQRYYYQAGGDTINSFAYKGYLAASQFVSATHQHPVTMRAGPTLTKVGTFNVTDIGQPTAIAATTVTYVWQAQKNGSTGAYGFYSDSSGGFTLDAEL